LFGASLLPVFSVLSAIPILAPAASRKEIKQGISFRRAGFHTLAE
jgi:hypothetical protein